MLECPALSETTLIGTPSIRSCVIWLWRSPWMLTCGMSSASMVRENRRERVLGMIAAPLWSVNKRSLGSRPSPSWSRTAACSALCLCNVSTVMLGREIRRRLLAVFGSFGMAIPFKQVMFCVTRRCGSGLPFFPFASRCTSHQRSPRTSPRLMPVVTARRIIG